MKAHVDGDAGRADGALGIAQADHVRQRSDGAAPGFHDRVGPQGALGRGQQIDADGGHMCAALKRVAVHAVEHADMAHQRRAVRLLRRQLGVDLFQPRFELRHDRLGARQRRALRQQHPRHDGIAVKLGKGGELEVAARHHADRNQQHREADPGHRIAPANGQVDERADQPVTGPGHASLDPQPQPLLRARRFEGVDQVMRQDQERLDQRHRQHEEHHHRHHPQHRAEIARQEGERAEDHRGGAERGQHVGKDLARALHRRLHRAAPLFAQPGDVFGDDDGIVHQQADHDQQAQRGHQVQRIADCPHQGDAAHEADRQAHRHPEGKAKAEEQPQHRKDQRQPLKPVDHHEGQPFAHHGGAVGGDFHGYARRRLGAFIVEKGVDRVDHPQAVFGAGLGDIEDRGGLAVEQDHIVIDGKMLGDIGNIAQPHLPARRRRAHEQIGQFLGAAPFLGDPDQQALGLGVEAARRHVEAAGADHAADGRRRQAEFAQRLGAQGDLKLKRREAVDIDLGNTAPAQHPGAHLVGIGFQLGP